MRNRYVESMEKWLILKQALKDKGYKIWQMQYQWDHPEGYKATFYKGTNQVTVITHVKEIEDDIVNSL